MEDRHLLSVLYWDPQQSGSSTAGGSGTWDDSAAIWYNADTHNDVVWNNANGDTAAFGGTAGTVAVASGGVSAGGIEFDTASYSLAGAAITLTSNNNSGWGDGEIRVNSTADTISAPLAGSVGLTKTGSGTLTLTGASTYSGPTGIQDGTVAIADADDRLPTGTALTVGGVLQLGDGTTGRNQTVAELDGWGEVAGGGANVATLTLALADNAWDMFQGYLGGDGIGDNLKLKITSPGTNQNGTFVLPTGRGVNNTYSGGTTLASGELDALNPAAIGSGPLEFAGGTFFVRGTLSNDIIADAVTTSYLMLPVQNVTLEGSISGAGTIHCTNGAGVSATLNLGGPQTDNSGFAGTFEQWNSAGGTMTTCFTSAGAGSAAATWCIDSGTLAVDIPGPATVQLGALRHNPVRGSGGTLTSGYSGSAVTFEIGGNNQSTEFDGTVTNGSGTVAVTKTGTGTLTLANSSTYTGGTTITGGALQLGNGTANGSIAGTITDNATLVFDNGSDQTCAGAINGGGAVMKTGSGTLTFTGGNVYTGVTTVSAGTLKLGDGTTNGSVAGDIANNAALVFADGTDQTYSGAVSGDGTLTKLGAGALSLTGANTYDGETTISAGTLRFTDAAGSFDMKGDIVDDAALIFDTAVRSGDDWEGSISGTGTFTKTGTRALELDGGDSCAGGTTIGGGRLAGGQGCFSGDGTIYLAGGTLNSCGTISNPIVVEANTTNHLMVYLVPPLTFAGNISGSGTIIQNTSGTINLAGDDSGFSGTYHMIGSATAACFTSPDAGSADATWQIDAGTLAGKLSASATIELGALSGTGNGVLSNAGSGTVTFEVGGKNQSSEFDGVVEDGTAPVALRKTGTAALALAGANAFSGGTTIVSGVLCAAGSLGDVSVEGGTFSPGLSGAGTGSTNDLTFATGGTYGVDLTDTGGGPVAVTGTVTLSGATLDVTSGRTNNDYGILRVLIRNDGSDAVDGNFDGLAEGDTVTVDGVAYWITYQYNAETGQFDTGNDVALVSSLFSVSPGPENKPVTVVSSQSVLDATHELDQYSSQFQLHTSLSSHDPNWPVGNPQITFSSEDPTVATVDSGGLVTFGQTGTCRILATSPATEFTPEQTFEFTLAGTVTQSWAYVPTTITPQNVGSYVLVLYNADSYGAADGCDSTDLMSYYKNNRPGMANATYLGISAAALDAIYHNLSVNGITSIPDNEPDYDGTIANQDPQKSMRISAANWRVCLDIGQYVASWIENNCPTIRYVVGLAGLPSRSDDYWCSDDAYGGFSVSYSIYQNCLATTHGTGYAGGTDRFSVAEYGAPLVAWLDCGTYAATRAYINKEISTANAGGLQSDGITISGNAAGVGGSTWVLDDAHHDYQTDLYQDYLVGPGSRFDFSDALYADQVNGTITVSADDYTIHWPNSQPAITNVANPTAYTSWGVHSGTLTSNWPDNGQVTFTGNAGWWIGTSVESYNGVYGDDMGDPTKVFAAMAFGGTNYSNTPICWVGSTAEPGGKWSGNSAYFDRWAKGSSPLEAAWSSITYAPGSSTAYILAVTDVFLQP